MTRGRLADYLRAGALRTRRAVATKALAGGRVACPICGWRGRRWWAGDRCPRCAAFPRHRLLPVALEHFGRPPDRARLLLHVGSGPTDMAYLRAAGAGRSVRVDLDTLDGDVAGDAAALPLRNGTVDLAVAWHVLEHVPDDRAAASELHRVLAPGGAAVVSVPLWPEGRAVTVEAAPDEAPAARRARHGDADHVRSCGLDYGARLASVGFRLDHLRAGDLAEDLVRRHGLAPEHHAWLLAPERG